MLVVKAEEESVLDFASVIESELDLKIIEDSKRINCCDDDGYNSQPYPYGTTRADN